MRSNSYCGNLLWQSSLTLLDSQGGLMLVVSLALGSVLGEWLDLELKLERFAAWIRRVTHNERDGSFINAFVTASLTVCVGAMAIVGSLQDGLKGDTSILYLKSVMDGVIMIVFVASLGRGAIFSAIPIVAYQGGHHSCGSVRLSGFHAGVNEQHFVCRQSADFLRRLESHPHGQAHPGRQHAAVAGRCRHMVVRRRCVWQVKQATSACDVPLPLMT